MEENLTQIVFQKAKYSKRVFAFMFDLLTIAISCLTLMTLFHQININSPAYKRNDQILTSYELSSGLYSYNGNGSLVVISNLDQYINIEDNEGYSEANVYFDTQLRSFYTNDFFFDTASNEGVNLYNNAKLNYVVSDEHLFIYKDNTKQEVVASLNASPSDLYDFYVDHIENKAITYLMTYTEYIDATKYISYSSTIVELLVPLVLSFSIFQLAIPLFLSRGKPSLGMLIFHLGYVDKYGLSPTWQRYLGSFIIYFFFEILLSLVTFGIPVIFSFSMFVFSKKNQSFSKYICCLICVDCTNDTIYKTEDELLSRRKKVENFELEDIRKINN